MQKSAGALEAVEVLSRAREVFGESTVAEAYDRLAREIAADFRDRDPVLLALMCGGMVPAVAIMQRLDFPFRFDYVHATRYGQGTRGGDLSWRVPPGPNLRGETVVVIDDILDRGTTLAALKARLSAVGVAAQRIAVLVERQCERDGSIAADYVGLRVGPGFLFGCGMDVAGYWRGLPTISATRDE